MEVSDIIRIILSGMLGTLGFSIVFKSVKSRIVCCAVGGAIVSAVYVACCINFENVFFQNFIPALIATVYAEVMARIMKAPATPILACSIIPLVPGGMLYYTTYYLVVDDDVNFYSSLSQTLNIAAGLAVGIICVSVVVNEVNRRKSRLPKNSAH